MHSDFDSVYNSLNEDQKKAVDTLDGAVLVIAGPGTGKTQVLSLRIANILKQTDTDPKSILCLTFQEASVHAMKTRLQRFIGNDAYKVQVHTFHSFCSEIIRTFPYLFDFNDDVEPIKDLDKLEIFREILVNEKLLNLQYRNDVLGNFKGIVSAISNMKKEYITPENFSLIIDQFENELDSREKKLEERRIAKLRDLQKFYRKYLDVMQEKSLIDFDDMIYRVTDAFSKNEDLVKFFQEQYLYTLVDEFQDTNNAQLEVIKAISKFEGLTSNVFAVGDDDQTIFRFQGASSDNFEKFLNIFPDSEIVVLHSNYRSKQEIIDASTKIIANNPNRISESQFFLEKNLDKFFKSGYKAEDSNEIPTQIHEFEHSFHEDYWIGEKIKEIAEKGVQLNEIAIISRTNRQITNITKFLDKHSIPYQIKRSESLLDDKSIKDILLLVKILISPDKLKDDSLVWKVLSLDFFKNQQFDIFSLYHEAKKNNQCIYDFLIERTSLSPTGLAKENHLPTNSKNQESLDLFIESSTYTQNSEELPTKYSTIIPIFQKLIDLQQFAVNNSFLLTFSKILHSLDLISYYENSEESYSALNKITSLYQFIQARSRFLPDYSIEDFLNEVKIMSDKNINLPIDPIDIDLEGKINILTAHSAKGLEFKYVFIYQCVENKWEKLRGANDGINLPPLDFGQSASGIRESTKKAALELEKIAAEIDERRLFYVAATRAKEYLYFTYSKKYFDSDSGEIDTSEKLPSKFLSESGIEEIQNHKDYVKEHEKIAKIILSPEKPVVVPQTNQDYLKSLVEKDLKLSASKVNKYQKCHYKFLLEDIYKIPTPQGASALLGSAVHEGIEKIYKLQIKDYELLEDLIAKEKTKLSHEVDSTQLEKEGSSKDVILNDLENSLRIYYEFYKENPVKRVASEFWSSGNLDGIRINGRIDMVSSEDTSDGTSTFGRGYVITDFKTSQNIPSITEFLGLTKNADKSHLRQLLFYRMLLEHSDLAQSRSYAGKIKFLKIEYIDLKDKKVKVFELPAKGDFEYKPRSNSKKTESYDLDNEYENLKKEIKETYSSIKNLEFTRTDDRRQCQFCPFKEHCKR